MAYKNAILRFEAAAGKQSHFFSWLIRNEYIVT